MLRYAALRFVAPALLLVAGCGLNSGAADAGGEGSDDGEQGIEIALEDLSEWTRFDEPVLRDPIVGQGYEYEVAADLHVFRTEANTLAGVYTGDVDGASAIKLARATANDQWDPSVALIAGPSPSGLEPLRETAFYRRAEAAHRIYYIGYTDEDKYDAQLFVAHAEALEGPYTLPEAPLFPIGLHAGHEVHHFTSPSIVAFEDRLYFTVLGWNAGPNDVTEVWVLGSTSEDDGETWSAFEEVETPVGMEGQVERGPDGRFYAVHVAAVEGADEPEAEGIFIAVADKPFGPYTHLDEPIWTKVGAPWEIDEAQAPQIFFDAPTRTAYLFYIGVDYAKGWWIMLASTAF